MRTRRVLSAICCLFVPATSQALAQASNYADCWQQDESTAAHVQNLQSFLMVQALKCQDTLPATTESYNKFLAAKRSLIIANRRAVVGHFVRQYGPEAGQAAFTAYETQLSNHSSSPVIDVAQCEKAGAYARFAAAASDADLLMLADVIAANTVISDCPAPTAPRAAMVMPVWPRPIPMRTAPTPFRPGFNAAAPQPEEDQGADLPPPYDPRLVPPEAPVQPAFAPDPRDGLPTTTVASAEPRPAAVPAPNQAEAVAALRAAVAALDRVAGTLQPETPPAVYNPQQE